MRVGTGLGKVQVFVLLSLAALLTLGAVPAVHAAVTTLDSTSCVFIGGAWNAGTSTCTLASPYAITSGNTFEVPSGTTLVVTNPGFVQVASGGTLAVDAGGSVILTYVPTGVFDEGTVTNSGTISAEGGSSAGAVEVGAGGTFNNAGTFNAVGTVNGIVSAEGSAFTNSGTINLAGTSGTYGIESYATSFTNSGTINVADSGDDAIGIINDGAIANSGTVDITNGAGSTGIENSDTITNVNCGTIDTSGSSGTAIDEVGDGSIGMSGTCSISAPLTVNVCEVGMGCYTTYAVFSVTESGSPVGGATVQVSAEGAMSQTGATSSAASNSALCTASPAWTAEWGQYWGCSAGETGQFTLTVGLTYSYTVTLPSGSVLTGSFLASNPWTVSLVSVSA